MPVFLVGHVTKDGAVAGPRVLEHMVDAVLYLEGERYHDVRVLRAAKNRFGSTRRAGRLRDGRGRPRARSPIPRARSSARRSRGPARSPSVAVEGTRPLLVEVQALVTHARASPQPQRVTNGFDAKRLAVLLAVLEKRVGVRVSHGDVFVNVAGGLTLEEPGADLGVALAVASAREDRVPLDGLVAFGEVGLGGRAAPRAPAGRARARGGAARLHAPRSCPSAQAAECDGLAASSVLAASDARSALAQGLGPRRATHGGARRGDGDRAVNARRRCSLAAGTGERLGARRPKATRRRSAAGRWSRGRSRRSRGDTGRGVVLVGDPKALAPALEALSTQARAKIVAQSSPDGATRQDSCRFGPCAGRTADADVVLVHDAARPFAEAALFDAVARAARRARRRARAPCRSPTRSSASTDGRVLETIERDGLWARADAAGRAGARCSPSRARARPRRTACLATDDVALIERLGPRGRTSCPRPEQPQDHDHGRPGVGRSVADARRTRSARDESAHRNRLRRASVRRRGARSSSAG